MGTASPTLRHTMLNLVRHPRKTDMLSYRPYNEKLSSLFNPNLRAMKAFTLERSLVSSEAMQRRLGATLFRDVYYFLLTLWSRSDALEKLLDAGLVYSTINDSHFRTP